MQAGKLRHIVDIEFRDNETQDTTGQPTSPWQPFITGVRAAIMPFSGRQLYAASEKMAEATTKIKLRYFDGLTDQMRVVHDGPNCCGTERVAYDIVHIADTELRHAEIQILCKSGLNEG